MAKHMYHQCPPRQATQCQGVLPIITLPWAFCATSGAQSPSRASNMPANAMLCLCISAPSSKSTTLSQNIRKAKLRRRRTLLGLLQMLQPPLHQRLHQKTSSLSAATRCHPSPSFPLQVRHQCTIPHRPHAMMPASNASNALSVPSSDTAAPLTLIKTSLRPHCHRIVIANCCH